MDFQPQPNGYQPNPNYSYNMNQAPQRNYMDKRSTGLATASIALGIVSIVTFCCLYAALPCGALAIILGLLPWRRDDFLHHRQNRYRPWNYRSCTYYCTLYFRHCHDVYQRRFHQPDVQWKYR